MDSRTVPCHPNASPSARGRERRRGVGVGGDRVPRMHAYVISLTAWKLCLDSLPLTSPPLLDSLHLPSARSALPHLLLIHSTLPCLTLPYFTSHCLTSLTHSAFSYLPKLMPSCLSLRLGLTHLALSHLGWARLVLPHLALTHPDSSCLASPRLESYQVLS